MRISRDASSWHARGVLRRDFRHDHSSVEGPTPAVKSPRLKTPDHSRVGTEPCQLCGGSGSGLPSLVPPEIIMIDARSRRATYRPGYWIWRCKACGRKVVRSLEHEAKILRRFGGCEARACSCGQNWQWQPGMSWRCPADYDAQYSRSLGRYSRKRELDERWEIFVTLRGDLLPSKLARRSW